MKVGLSINIIQDADIQCLSPHGNLTNGHDKVTTERGSRRVLEGRHLTAAKETASTTDTTFA